MELNTGIIVDIFFLQIKFTGFNETDQNQNPAQRSINGGLSTSIPKSQITGGQFIDPLTVAVNDSVTYVFTKYIDHVLLIGTSLENEVEITFKNQAGRPNASIN